MQTAPLFLLQSAVMLITVGVVMIYSVEINEESRRLLWRQLAWIAAGLPVAYAFYRLDYRRLAAWNPLALGACVLLLILVLVPGIGTQVHGARRWIDLGPVGFQPSEFAKLGLILFLAWYGERYRRHMHTLWRGLCVPALVCGPALFLIFVEPDRGTTMLMCAVLAAMLLVAGVRLSMLAVPVLAGAAGLVLALAADPLRMGRIRAWLDPESMKDGVAYQVVQSLTALGAGGLAGEGLGEGRFKNGYLPLHQTDFIFSTLGEELGLVGTLGVLALYCMLIVAGIVVAIRARDTFGFLLAAGITFLIGLQAFINIGVVTNTLPNKGLTLPLISYGGSSLVVMMAAVGILMSVARLGRMPAAQGGSILSNPFAQGDHRQDPAPRPLPGEESGMRVAIACGGTGGHFFPGVAVAESVLERGGSVRLLASRKDVDRQAAASLSGMPVEFLPSAGWSRGSRLAFLKGAAASAFASFRLFRAWRPRALLVMGGFSGVGPAVAARLLRVPVWLHESNSIPGRANRLLSRIATGVMVGFPQAARAFPGRRVVASGTPVRSSLSAPPAPGARGSWGLSAEGPLLLVMGGSQGARAINRIMLGVAPLLAQRHPDLQIIHLTGSQDNGELAGCYRSLGLGHCLMAFSTEAPLMVREATAALSRSGASSLAEYAAARVPALLVPYPGAVEDHQRLNAEMFGEDGAAEWIEERDLEPGAVARCLSRLLGDPEAREAMKRALGRWDAAGAASRIASRLMDGRARMEAEASRAPGTERTLGLASAR